MGLTYALLMGFVDYSSGLFTGEPIKREDYLFNGQPGVQ